MSTQQLSAFESSVVSGLASRASIAACVLNAWSDAPPSSIQTARSLTNLAQLGVTEEASAGEVLTIGVVLGIFEVVEAGFRARSSAYANFKRLAFALNAIHYYRTKIHCDETTAQVVLTKPPRPSVLEERLAELGWVTSDLEPTEHAFRALVQAATKSVVVMTPFFDLKGSQWLQELLVAVRPGVSRALVLRSLEEPTRPDYPVGYDAILPWLQNGGIAVYNYSLPRVGTGGRETFHAKVVLCDRTAAYLGSSNLTAASLEHSMEMGVMLRGRAAMDVAVVMDGVLAAARRIL